MKGGATHEVPLTDDVMAILKLWFKNGDYVFSTTFGCQADQRVF